MLPARVACPAGRALTLQRLALTGGFGRAVHPVGWVSRPPFGPATLIRVTPELRARVIRLLKWAHDVALQDAALPDAEKARLIGAVVRELEHDSGAGPYAPERLLEHASAQAAWLAEVVTRAAVDLERLGHDAGRSASDRAKLLRLAQQLRRQVHTGPPEGWAPQGARGTDRDDEAEG
jgi:hypothetical protein